MPQQYHHVPAKPMLTYSTSVLVDGFLADREGERGGRAR